MYKYVIIILLLSNLFSYNYEDQKKHRVDFNYRTLTIPQNNNFRDEEELLQFIESIMQSHLIPGLSISVVKDNNIVWEKYKSQEGKYDIEYVFKHWILITMNLAFKKDGWDINGWFYKITNKNFELPLDD